METLIKIDTATDLDKLHLPANVEDEYWDERMSLPVDKLTAQDLAENGQKVPLILEARAEGGYHIVDGRQRVKATPLANKMRAKLNLPPLVLTGVLREKNAEAEPCEAALDALRINEHRQQSNPVTLAKSFWDALKRGASEEEIAEAAHMSVSRVNAHLPLLDLPDDVQAAVIAGKLSVTAAAGFAKLDKASISSAFRKLQEESKSGKVTAKAAALGKGTVDRLGAKAIKDMVAQLRASDIKGEHGDFVKAAAIAALEMVLDSRKVDDLFATLHALGKGKLPEVEATPSAE